MKQKGFTLIELIVVIAIIGVLAAILVPAMMGYVTRSKITSANSNAKSVFNALNIAMVEMEEYDLPPQVLTGDITSTGAGIYAQKDYPIPETPTKDIETLKKILFAKITQYFSDVRLVNDVTFRLSGYGAQGVGIMLGNYPGSYPIAITNEDYQEFMSKSHTWDSTAALGRALEDEKLYNP